MLLNSENFIF